MNSRFSLVSLILLGLLSCALYGVSLLTKGNRETFSCQSNLKQIGLGLKQYERDYDEKTVSGGNWASALWPYTKSHQIFTCSSVANNYAFNRYASGVSHSQIRDYTGTPTVFDSTSNRRNSADFGTSYVANGAHSLWQRGRGTNVLFFDGHVNGCSKNQNLKR